MKYVVVYEAAEDFRARASLYIEQHRALWQEFHEAGTLLMLGPFTDEPAGGASCYE